MEGSKGNKYPQVQKRTGGDTAGDRSDYANKQVLEQPPPGDAGVSRDDPLQEQITILTTNYNKLKNKIDGFKDEIGKDTSERISTERIRTIELLGLFISIFTFISVEIQIFRNPQPILSVTGFTLILLGSLLLFLIILNYITHEGLSFQNYTYEGGILQSARTVREFITGRRKIKKSSVNPLSWPNGTQLLLLSILLIIGGIFCIQCSPPAEYSFDREEEIIEKIEKNEDNLNKFENSCIELKEKVNNIKEKEDKLETDISKLQESKK